MKAPDFDPEKFKSCPHCYCSLAAVESAPDVPHLKCCKCGNVWAAFFQPEIHEAIKKFQASLPKPS